MRRNLPNQSRRAFIACAGTAACATMFSMDAHPKLLVNGREQRSPGAVLTGNGAWTYEVVSGWGALPADTSFGGTHGAIAQDKAGHIYVSTQSRTGVLVYSSDGHLVRTIATQYPEVHSMVYAEEDGTEYFYTTVQKGTARENWLFVKMKTDGTPVLKITAPPQAVVPIERDVNLSEDVIRVLVTRADHLNETEMNAVEPFASAACTTSARHSGCTMICTPGCCARASSICVSEKRWCTEQWPCQRMTRARSSSSMVMPPSDP